MLVYVDHVIITGTSLSYIATTKKKLHSKFMIKDLGPLKYFLGLEIARSSDGTIINQQNFILDLLEETSMKEAKPVVVPLLKSPHLSPNKGNILTDPSKYR